MRDVLDVWTGGWAMNERKVYQTIDIPKTPFQPQLKNYYNKTGYQKSLVWESTTSNPKY